MSSPVEMPFDQALTALGGHREYRPVPLERSKFFWLADCKTGKTTLLCSMPGNLILDMEMKTDNIPFKRAGCVAIPDYTTLEQKVSALEAARRQHGDQYPIKHVTFDSVDKLQLLCLNHLEQNEWKDKNGRPVSIHYHLGGKGGWAELALRVLSFSRRLYLAGYGVSTIGHLKRTTDEDGKLTGALPSCTPLIAGALAQDAHTQAGLVRLVRQLPIEWKEIAGKRIPIKFGPPIPVVEVRLQKNPDRPDDWALGSQIEMPLTFEVPAVDGWSVIARLAAEAVARKRAEITEMSKKSVAG